MWSIRIKESAERAMLRLSAVDRRRVDQRILSLAENPRPSWAIPMKGQAKGLWRARVGDLRIIYQIRDAEMTILIVEVGIAAKSTGASERSLHPSIPIQHPLLIRIIAEQFQRRGARLGGRAGHIGLADAYAFIGDTVFAEDDVNNDIRLDFFLDAERMQLRNGIAPILRRNDARAGVVHIMPRRPDCGGDNRPALVMRKLNRSRSGSRGRRALAGECKNPKQGGQNEARQVAEACVHIVLLEHKAGVVKSE
jgi:mRNA interferase RelE/StbE